MALYKGYTRGSIGFVGFGLLVHGSFSVARTRAYQVAAFGVFFLGRRGQGVAVKAMFRLVQLEDLPICCITGIEAKLGMFAKFMLWRKAVSCKELTHRNRVMWPSPARVKSSTTS